jgi:carboxymethylenebutenolidase
LENQVGSNSSRLVKYGAILAETLRMPGHQGGLIEAFVSRPLSAGPYPAVIVMHHLPGGFDPESKEFAQRLSALGYTVIIPNLHWRYAPGMEHNAAADLVRAMPGGRPIDAAVGDAEGAMALAQQFPNWNGKTGIIGICAGGCEAWWVGVRNKIDAIVVAWGGGIAPNGPPGNLTEKDLRKEASGEPWPLTQAESLHAPVLGLFGGKDLDPSVHAVKRIDDRLAELGHDHRFHVYPEAGHAFMAPDRPVYHRESSVDAWVQIERFFAEYLSH